jgi:hypothetical protein
MENKAFQGVTPRTGFWLLLVQDVEGCDYTIGCGMLAHPLAASTVMAAREEAAAFLMDSDGNLIGDRENPLSHAVLVMAHEELPLDELKSKYRAKRAADAAAEQRAKDLADLERLKRKLER